MGTVPQKPVLPSMNASVWAALFCLFFSTYSQAAPVASALQQDCSRLYSVMVNQSDPRVLGYQDPDGGLCGPTCLLNPLLVDARRKGLALPAPEELMSQLNSIHHDLTGTHGIGTGVESTWVMPQLAENFFRARGFPRATGNRMGFSNGFSVKDIVNPDKPNSFSLLTISAFDNESNRELSAHYVLVVGLDQQKKEILYIDPNFPGELRKLGYREGNWNELDITSNQLGYIGEKSGRPRYLKAGSAIFVDMGEKDLPPLSARAIADIKARSAGLVKSTEEKFRQSADNEPLKIEIYFQTKLKLKAAAQRGVDFKTELNGAGMSSIGSDWENGVQATVSTPEEKERILKFLRTRGDQIFNVKTKRDVLAIAQKPGGASPWIEAIKGTSPPPEAIEKDLGPFGLAWPAWAGPSPIPAEKIKNLTVDKMSMETLPAFPKSQLPAIEKLMAEMGEAKSYQDGIVLLKKAMTEAGLIEHFPKLELIHASDVAPGKVQEAGGLLSAQELKARGLGGTRWGQNIGDGVYFTGAEGWGENSWGRYQYRVTLKDKDLLRGANRYLAGYLRIYDLFRGKWHLERYADDSQMVPGLPQGIFSYNGLLSRMPFAYEDLGVAGVSSSLEILIKAKKIPNEQIAFPK